MELDIRDLTIEYSSGGYVVRPIRGFSLTANSGSLVLLLGPSGSGKTSLLSCLGGILTPTQGRMRLGDIDVGALTGKALTSYRRRTAGIIFEGFNLVPSLTALENVMLPLRNGGIDRRRASARAGELLQRLGLSERVQHRPGRMSAGQQQRIAIARALAFDPPLLLADEPTAHLDDTQVAQVTNLLRELTNSDRLVVVATHDQRILPVADRVVDLASGPGANTQEPAVRLPVEGNDPADAIGRKLLQRAQLANARRAPDIDIASAGHHAVGEPAVQDVQ